MTTTITPLADTEGAMRTYLRTQPDVNALVSGRVFFGIPKNALFPLITIKEVGPGVVDPGDAPIGWELLQFDVWGNGQDKRGARVVRDMLVAVLDQLPSGTMLDATTQAKGARLFNSIYSPDPDSAQARYSITAYVMTSKVA